MTKKVLSVFPETLLTDAANHMIKNGYSGLPVVNKNNKLIGILTDYDFLTKVHLPTFIKIFSDTPKPTDEHLIKGSLTDVLAFTVKDVANNDPLVLNENSSIVEVTQAFSEHHRVNPVPIINSSRELVGIISRYDVIKFYAYMLKSGGNSG